MTREKAIEQTLPAVNELLAKAPPAIGAYCMGAICALAWQDNEPAARTILEVAAECTEVKQAAALWREFARARNGGIEG